MLQAKTGCLTKSYLGICRKLEVWLFISACSHSERSLIFAAMETTSGALAHILQMLSEHQDVQDKLRQEIIAARGDKEQIGYDELVSLPYLEAICRETLRL